MASVVPPKQLWVTSDTGSPAVVGQSSQSTQSSYNFQLSDIVLKVGGQILIIIIIMLILYIGAPPIVFPKGIMGDIFGAKGT
jgi:hypothetical protein